MIKSDLQLWRELFHKLRQCFRASFTHAQGLRGDPLYSRQGKMSSTRTGNFVTLIQPFLKFCAIFRLSKAPQTLLHALYCHCIAGRYSCCRHQCWGWSSHPQQLANRHGQDIAYDCCQLPPPTRCAGFFSNMKSNYSCLSMPRRNLLSLQIICQGSTTMIIVPLTTIK